MKEFFILLALAIISVQCQEEKEWWRTASFYQVYPRSFMDTNHDGIGDLKGIIQRLDHLKDTGFDTYWLSPIFKSPQKDTGYDVSDYYEIEPDYGNMQDFENLIKKSKELGIRVMLDFIPNHTSDQHIWFELSKRREPGFEDFYVWHNGRPNPDDPSGRPLEPNNWVSVFTGPAWTWVPEREQYYLHQFYAEQPDLNYNNPAVVTEMTEMLKFYIDKGVAGFRLDAINHLFEDPQFRDEPIAWYKPNDTIPFYYDDLEHIHTKDLQATFDHVYYWRKVIDEYAAEKNIKEDILIMTEAYASTEDTMRYIIDPKDERRGAHMPFNFQLIYLNRYSNANQVKERIFEYMDNKPPGESANWVMSSHDHSRMGSRHGGEFINAYNTLVLTLPGASITYYGDEIGMYDNMDVPDNDDRNKNRTPMQWTGDNGGGFTTRRGNETWLPMHPNRYYINVQTQQADPNSIYNYFRKVIKLRKTDAIRKGSFTYEVINEHVYAYSRVDEATGHGYLIVTNMSGEEQLVDLSKFSSFYDNNKLRVEIADPSSHFTAGQEVDKDEVLLGLYDTVIFTSSSTSIALSFTLLVKSIFISLFN